MASQQPPAHGDVTYTNKVTGIVAGAWLDCEQRAGAHFCFSHWRHESCCQNPTVDGCEILHHLGWLKPYNRDKTTYQLVQDFFHQQ